MKTALRVLLVVNILSWTGSVVLADQANFNGTWVLDTSKSEARPAAQARTGGAAVARTDLPNADLKLVVTQTADQIVVQRGFTAKGKGGARLTQTFRLDGTETKNPVLRGEMNTRASWNEGALVLKGTQKITNQKRDVATNLEEKWALTEDGKTLTITTTRSMQRGRSATTRLVYNKQ